MDNAEFKEGYKASRDHVPGSEGRAGRITRLVGYILGNDPSCILYREGLIVGDLEELDLAQNPAD